MLLSLLAATVVLSILHYVDNIVFFGSYPEPHWMTPHLVDAFWFVMTPVGVVGYLLFRRGLRGWALLVLCAYGAMNLLTLGHYLYASPWSLSLRINAFILAEAVAAVALSIAAAWFARRSVA